MLSKKTKGSMKIDMERVRVCLNEFVTPSAENRTLLDRITNAHALIKQVQLSFPTK